MKPLARRRIGRKRNGRPRAVVQRARGCDTNLGKVNHRCAQSFTSVEPPSSRHAASTALLRTGLRGIDARRKIRAFPSAAPRMVSRDGPRPTRSPVDAQARVLARRAAAAVHCTERLHGTATQNHAARALHGEAVCGRKPLRLRHIRRIGAAGFEPTTSCSQSRRSTKLSYAPRREQCTACGARFPVSAQVWLRQSPVLPVPPVAPASPCAPPRALGDSGWP